MNVIAPEAAGIPSARLGRIDAVMQRYIDERKFAGIQTLIAHHGQMVHHATFRHMDRETGKPMQPDTIFRKNKKDLTNLSGPYDSLTASALLCL